MKNELFYVEIAFVLVLLVLIACLSGCKTIAPTVAIPHNDSIVLRYVYLHDSVYIDRNHFERQNGDTVYIRDTVTLKYFSIQNKCDTLYKDKEVVVTLPPEKYVPAFYKWCVGILIGLVVLIVGYVVLRIVMKVYLMK